MVHCPQCKQITDTEKPHSCTPAVGPPPVPQYHYFLTVFDGSERGGPKPIEFAEAPGVSFDAMPCWARLTGVDTEGIYHDIHVSSAHSFSVSRVEVPDGE